MAFNFGSTCQNAVLPALVRPPFPPVQPTLDLKPFLPFPLDTAVNLFPNFNASLVGISSRTDQFQPFGSWKAGISASQLCVSMDPVQKAVINHTFGVPPKRKHIIPCNICQLRFNSESQASAHYKGTKHAKKLKAREAPKKKQKAAATKDSAKTTFTIITTNTINTNTDRTANVYHLSGQGRLVLTRAYSNPSHHKNQYSNKTDSTTGIPLLRLSTATAAEPAAALTNCSVQTSTETTLGANQKEVATTGSNSCLPMETEDEKAKRLLYCSLCKVAVNSASQLEAHNSGTKHITMLEARSGSGTIKAFPRPAIKGKVASTTKAITGLQNKTFHCEVCNVHVNSETQLKQHISSRRHKDRAAGKPPKPKYSPYNKAQRGTTAHAVKLTLRKEPGKTLTPRILPNHITAAAMTAAASAVGSPFALRSTPAGALFQAQALSPALLRPAPGPIRTPHTPVLFAPY